MLISFIYCNAYISILSNKLKNYYSFNALVLGCSFQNNLRNLPCIFTIFMFIYIHTKCFKTTITK